MGHPGACTLWETQKVVDGMPTMPKTPALFACALCYEAKTRKCHSGPADLEEQFSPKKAYHMDLGFFRGPQTKTKSDKP